MAEISTIARPYAEALMQSVRDSKDEGLADRMLPVLESLGEIASNPVAKDIIDDPSLTKDQVFDSLRGLLPADIPQEANNLLRLLAENGRLEVASEISRQFKELLHKERSEAEVVIETAFPIEQEQLDSLLEALGKRFPGLKLLPQIVVDNSLIGGVKVKVGDKVLDGTVKARLAEMHAALTS